MKDNTRIIKYDSITSYVKKVGVENLSNEDLISAIIGIDTLKQDNKPIREVFDGSRSLRNIAKKPLSELMAVKGIGEKKAIALLVSFEIGKRLMREESEEQQCLDSALAIKESMLPFVRDLNNEVAYVLCMDRKFRLIKRVMLSKGGFTETAVDVRDICKQALLCNATVVAIVHNHPSASCLPSIQDDAITKQVKDGCKTMRLHLVDHVIINSKEGTYYSYRESGKL
jgi:DNA repair protein RadC